MQEADQKNNAWLESRIHRKVSVRFSGGSQKPNLATGKGAGSPPNIADLLQHGLLQASFVPPRPQRELRELTRFRSSLTAERARLVNRIHKVLEDTNIKLTSVATDITGKSGRAILDALLDGQDDPRVLAELARGRMRSKRNALAQAVQGTLSEHHRFILLAPVVY